MDKDLILEVERKYLVDENSFHAIKTCFDILLSEISVPRTEDRWIEGGYLNITFRARGKNRIVRLPVGKWKSSPSYCTEETLKHDKQENERIAKLWREEYIKLRKEFFDEQKDERTAAGDRL